LLWHSALATIAAKAQLVSASASDSAPGGGAAAPGGPSATAATTTTAAAAQSFSGVALDAHQYVWGLGVVRRIYK